jgi:hypothetical protein
MERVGYGPMLHFVGFGSRAVAIRMLPELKCGNHLTAVPDTAKGLSFRDSSRYTKSRNWQSTVESEWVSTVVIHLTELTAGGRLLVWNTGPRPVQIEPYCENAIFWI